VDSKVKYTWQDIDYESNRGALSISSPHIALTNAPYSSELD
jgi:hypothetical protein